MRVLVGIPVLYNGSVCLQAFKSVIEEADLFIVDNGAEEDVKQAILEMSGYNDIRHRVSLIRNENNQYVNYAWNQIIGAFLENSCPYEQLVIMNSDLIMTGGWSNHLVNGISCIPNDGGVSVDTDTFEGNAGVFIHLNKMMARLVYPIPDSIRLWYGDSFIQRKLHNEGYKQVIKAEMVCHHVHGGSVTVRRLPEFQEIIQQDMIAWKEIEKTI